MDKPQKRLWRKIGLQKNFLQGTSHSEQSKNTFSHQEDLHLRTQSENSNLLGQHLKLLIMECDEKYENDARSQIKQVIKYQNSDNCSLQSPIDNLIFQSFEERYMIQARQAQPVHRMGYNKQQAIQGKQIPYYLQSLNMKYLDQLSSRNSIMMVSNIQKKCHQQNIILNLNQHSLTSDRKTDHFPNDSIISDKNQFNAQEYLNSQNQIITSGPFGENVPQSDEDQIQLVKCQQMFTVSQKQMESYQKIEKDMIKLKLNKIPKLLNLINQYKKNYIQGEKFIQTQITSMKIHYQSLFQFQVSQQIQQYTDQIGYLYSQNEQLMEKIQKKQCSIKKMGQQIEKLKALFVEMQSKQQNEDDEKQVIIINQQNQINRLYQKMQDVEQTENNCQILKLKVKDLQQKIERLNSNQVKLEDDIETKEQVIQDKQQKMRQLQGQINILCIKMEGIEYRTNKQTLQKLYKQQCLFQAQKQEIVKEELQVISREYEQVMEELIKQINTLEIANIIKKFSIQKNQYMIKIFERVNKQNSQSLGKSSLETRLNHLLTDSGRLGPKGNPDNGSSPPNKNLRNTGFFGQVTKGNLSVRLNDIQKKFSTQIPQDQENSSELHDCNSASNRRKSRFIVDNQSYNSEQEFRQQYLDQNRPLQIYPRYGQGRSMCLRDQQRKQSEPLNNSNRSGLNSTMNRMRTQFYQQKNDQTTFKNIHNYRPAYKVHQNHNYSFSQLHTQNQNPRKSSIPSQRTETYKQTTKIDRLKPEPERDVMVQKIKERLKLKFSSKDKCDKQPTYCAQFSNQQKQGTCRDKQYNLPKPTVERQDKVLADIYEKHNLKNRFINLGHSNTPYSNVSLHSSTRFPSNSRSRSPSNSMSSRVGSNTSRSGINNYTKINRPTENIIAKAFTKSLIERPQFVTQSRVATYQPNSSLYSNDRGQAQGSYFQKY